MALLDTNSSLIVNEKKYNVGDLLNALVKVPGNYLVDFLKEQGLTIPRKLRIGVLKQILKGPILQTIEERKTLADEMGYRLTWFSRYTDTQLVNLLEWYKDLKLSEEYLYSLWSALIPYFIDKGVAENNLEVLFNYANSLGKNAAIVSTSDFNKVFNEVLFDDQGEIDGVTPENFRPVLYNSSTLTELREIGRKYNAPVPLRLKKKELLEVIFNKLEERNELNDELKEKLPKLNIILLERYAKDHKILASTDLKKEEIIEYILSNAKETREKYFAPQSSAVYEKEVSEVEEELDHVPIIKKKEEEVVPEPVEEVVKEPVKEVVREEPVYVRGDQIDYRPNIDKLTNSFESFVEAIAKKEFVININVGSTEKESPKKVVFEEEVGLSGIDNNQLIAALFSESQPAPITVNVGSTEKEVVLEEETPVLVEEVVEYKPKRGLLIFSGILLILSSLLLILLGLYFIPQISQLPYIENLLGFQGVQRIDYFIVVPLLATGVINFFIALKLFSKKISRNTIIVLGVILIFTATPIATALVLLAGLGNSSKTVKQVTNVDKTDEVESVKVGQFTKRPMPRVLLGFASFFAVLSLLAWLGVLALALPVVDRLNIITDHITFYDVSSIPDLYIWLGSGGLALLNLLFAVRFASKNIRRFETFLYGLLSLVTGFVVTGVFGLLASFITGKYRPVKEVTVKKKERKPMLKKTKYLMSRPLLILASFTAFLSAVLWIGIAVMAIPQVNQLHLITDHITFYDFSALNPGYIIGGAAGLAVLSLILTVRFGSKRINRFEALILSILALPAGFVVTGVFGLLAVLSNGKKAPDKVVNESSEIAVALNNVAENMKYLKNNQGSSLKVFFILIFSLIALAFVALLALYLVWRLPQTVNYQDFELFGIGEMIKKVIESFFGSAHF